MEEKGLFWGGEGLKGERKIFYSSELVYDIIAFFLGARAGCFGLRFATVLYCAKNRRSKGTKPVASLARGLFHIRAVSFVFCCCSTLSRKRIIT